jgi:hypothetical protein
MIVLYFFVTLAVDISSGSIFVGQVRGFRDLVASSACRLSNYA